MFMFYSFKINRLLYSMLVFATAFLAACISDDNVTEIAYKPVTIETAAPTYTTTVAATIGAKISAPQERQITHGVCWSISQNPEVNLTTKTSQESGIGTFTYSMTALSPSTTYYVRAYATDSKGTVYGNQVTFTTNAIGLPTLTTNAVSDITQTTATCGGAITADGEGVITARGVCWSTADVPTLSNSITTDGTGIGTFASNLTGLTAGTTFFVRAYSTNSAGTVYGNTLTFKTSPTIPTVTITPLSAITTTTASCGGNITSDGGGSITARGICWSTNGTPTIANSKTTDGTGTGAFTSSLSGLTTFTNYTVRAYATNIAGTAYSPELSFTTNGTIADIEGNTYHTITIGTQIWMVENLKTTRYNDGSPISNVTDNTAWAALSTGAYCWYNNDITNKTAYGALYNWYAVNTAQLAPAGWHVPTDAEWTTLTDYLGGTAADKMKESGITHWASPNNGNNSSGFSALPGGNRSSGMFIDQRFYGVWLSRTENNSTNAWIRVIDKSGNIDKISGAKSYGFSVRCIRD